MARYEAYLLKDWEKTGITRVVFTRTREGGWLEAGVFLVDAFCLGVKDAFLIEAQAVDWQHELNRIFPAMNASRCTRPVPASSSKVPNRPYRRERTGVDAELCRRSVEGRNRVARPGAAVVSRFPARALRAWPDEWEPVFARPELQRHIGVIAAIAEEGPATTLDDPTPADELLSAVGTALLALREAFPQEVDN